MSEPAYSAADTEQVRSVGNAFLRLRPFLVAPAAAAILTVTWAGGGPSNQLGALGVLTAVVVGFFSYEAWRSLRVTVTLEGFARSLALTVGLIGCLSWLTGAIESPVLPVFFAPVVVGLAAFGRARASLLLVAWFFVVLGLLLVLTPLRPFPPYAAWQLRAMTVAAFLLSVLLIGTGVVGLVDAHRRAGVELDKARARALEDAVSRTRDLETLSAKVAHEIRNPLVSIKGLVQLLSRSANARDNQRFDVVLSEVDRLESIVKDYLSFAKPIDSLKPLDTDLEKLLFQLASVVDALAAPKGVRLRVTAPPGLCICVDEVRVKQALFNLLSNALEATPRGGTVELSAERSERSAAITVKDSGRGMPADVLSRVGTAFFTTRERGTGLGVAIARGIALQHGGTLEFDSEPGRGTTVTLCLPLTERKALSA